MTPMVVESLLPDKKYCSELVMPKVDTMVLRPLGYTWKHVCLPCWKGAKTRV
jgi:hypothetical protein